MALKRARLQHYLAQVPAALEAAEAAASAAASAAAAAVKDKVRTGICEEPYLSVLLGCPLIALWQQLSESFKLPACKA